MSFRVQKRTSNPNKWVYLRDQQGNTLPLHLWKGDTIECLTREDVARQWIATNSRKWLQLNHYTQGVCYGAAWVLEPAQEDAAGIVYPVQLGVHATPEGWGAGAHTNAHYVVMSTMRAGCVLVLGGTLDGVVIRRMNAAGIETENIIGRTLVKFNSGFRLTPFDYYGLSLDQLLYGVHLKVMRWQILNEPNIWPDEGWKSGFYTPEELNGFLINLIGYYHADTRLEGLKLLFPPFSPGGSINQSDLVRYDSTAIWKATKEARLLCDGIALHIYFDRTGAITGLTYPQAAQQIADLCAEHPDKEYWITEVSDLTPPKDDQPDPDKAKAERYLAFHQMMRRLYNVKGWMIYIVGGWANSVQNLEGTQIPAYLGQRETGI